MNKNEKKDELRVKLQVTESDQNNYVSDAQAMLNSISNIMASQNLREPYAGLKLAQLANWMEMKAEDVHRVGMAMTNNEGDVIQLKRQLMELDEDGTEYNPNKWNRWPAFTPPENVRLCVEYEDKDGRTYRTCLIYSLERWNTGFCEHDLNWVDLSKAKNIRFKAWD